MIYVCLSCTAHRSLPKVCATRARNLHSSILDLWTLDIGVRAPGLQGRGSRCWRKVLARSKYWKNYTQNQGISRVYIYFIALYQLCTFKDSILIADIELLFVHIVRIFCYMYWTNYYPTRLWKGTLCTANEMNSQSLTGAKAWTAAKAKAAATNCRGWDMERLERTHQCRYSARY